MEPIVFATAKAQRKHSPLRKGLGLHAPLWLYVVHLFLGSMFIGAVAGFVSLIL